MSIRIICLILLLFSVSVLANNRAVVTSSTAALRGSPSTDGKVITTFIKGAEVEIDVNRHRNGFFYAFSNKKKGWVRGAKIDIKIREPGRNTVWLYIGRTEKVNGFSVAYHLNVTQLIRNGDLIKFWTKAVPDVKKPYLARLLGTDRKVAATDFEYNADLWEGDCETKSIRARRTLLYWSDGRVSRFNFARQGTEASPDSAGKSILAEACKIWKRK